VWWSLVAPAGLWEQSLLGLAPAMVPVQPAVTTPGVGEGVSVPESEGELAKAGSKPTVVTAAIESAKVVRRRRIRIHFTKQTMTARTHRSFSTTSTPGQGARIGCLSDLRSNLTRIKQIQLNQRPVLADRMPPPRRDMLGRERSGRRPESRGGLDALPGAGLLRRHPLYSTQSWSLQSGTVGHRDGR